MRYLSICSGIEAATVAWHPLGWQPVAFAEIEAFPSAVLAHHYPGTPNLGDLTRFRDWDPALLAEVDLLVGGTPCQAFSVAGLRQSLDDQRGNLTLTLVHLYDHLTALRHAAGRPAPLLLWENVPGVLNTKDNAFGCLLGGLAGEDGPLQPPGGRWLDAGHVRGPRRTIAWRLLDAQYFGLAQRRERVFLVAGPRDSFRAEQVLFEWQSLRRDSPPRREEREGITHSIAPCLTSGGRETERTGDTRGQDPVVAEIRAFGGNNSSGAIEAAPALNANRGCHNPGDFEAGTLLVAPFDLAQITSAANRSRVEPGMPNGTLSKDSQPHVTIAFPEYLSGTQCAAAENLSPTLQSVNPTAVAFNLRGREGGAMPEADPDNLACQRAASGGSSRSYVAFQSSQSGVRIGETHATLDSNNGSRRHNGVIQGCAVRRLTPRECERLQGFPDDYTLIPWRSKPAQDCPDGPRYKALGNSMAVPVMNWIGRRLASWFDNTSNPHQ